MIWYRGVSEWWLCTCWYTVHQSLPTFLEISACMLEIATLGIIPDPSHDSCSWDQAGVSIGQSCACSWLLEQVAITAHDRTSPRAAISSMQAEISGRVGND